MRSLDFPCVSFLLNHHRRPRFVVFVFFVAVLFPLPQLVLLNSLLQEERIEKENPILTGSKQRSVPIKRGKEGLSHRGDTTGLSNSDNRDYVSACLLVNDDNHFLIEWLSYHYFVAGLRRLIVAPDPTSRTSIDPIINRWKHYMQIDVMPNESTKEHTNNGHLNRQKRFNIKCLSQLKQEGSGWTMLIDVDEYLLVNPKIKRTNTELPKWSIEDPSSVLKALHHLDETDENNRCIHASRKQFGTQIYRSSKESSLATENFWNSTLQTIHFRHEGLVLRNSSRCEYIRTLLLPGKSIVNLRKISPEDLVSKSPKMGNAHVPLPFCHVQQQNTTFIVHHYVGTRSQYMYRSLDARGTGMREARYQFYKDFHGQSYNEDIVFWIDGFFETMGKKEATRLLEGVGELEVNVESSSRSTVSELQHATDISFFTQNMTFDEGEIVQVNVQPFVHKPAEWIDAEVYHVLPSLETYNAVRLSDCRLLIGVSAHQMRKI